MKKIFSLILILSTLVLAVASCGTKETVYKKDVKTNSIYETVSKLLKNKTETYIYAPENAGFNSLGEKFQGDTHAKYTVGIEDAWSNDYFIESTGGNGCFEYGVFKTNSEEAKASVKAKLEEYITKLKNDGLGLSYSPDDKLILDKATVKVFGDYVVYVITPADDMNTILTRTENLLTQE